MRKYQTKEGKTESALSLIQREFVLVRSIVEQLVNGLRWTEKLEVLKRPEEQHEGGMEEGPHE